VLVEEVDDPVERCVEDVECVVEPLCVPDVVEEVEEVEELLVVEELFVVEVVFPVAEVVFPFEVVPEVDLPFVEEPDVDLLVEEVELEEVVRFVVPVPDELPVVAVFEVLLVDEVVPEPEVLMVDPVDPVVVVCFSSAVTTETLVLVNPSNAIDPRMQAAKKMLFVFMTFLNVCVFIKSFNPYANGNRFEFQANSNKCVEHFMHNFS
jgi:hypothetical protein